MFKQSCFIYKNTPELRQYLDKVGYKYGGKASKFDQPYLYCSLDKYFECNSFPARYHGIIDCAENEDLFLALASLRDDTDIYQWFVMDVEEYIEINQGDWFLATDRNKGKHIGTQIDPMCCHKATVNELLEHFKD